MSRTASRRTAPSTLTSTVVSMVVLAAAAIGALVYQSAASSAGTVGGVRHDDRGDPPFVAAADGAVTEADGALPDTATVFDDGHPGVSNLDHDLLRAVRHAATDAAADGIEFHVNSGWRSAEYQDQLVREAVSEYGSAEEAARWVASADASAHVSGDAVDIGPPEAAAWLSEHGAEYGLCQVYANEPWHFELRPGRIDHGCPDMYADPTVDPRMQP